jgi:excisionase family DNA binding protein
LAAADVLDPESRSGRLRVSTTSVTHYVAEENRWVTRSEAAQLLGCSRSRVARLVRTGELTTRATGRGGPSVLREDVEALAGV